MMPGNLDFFLSEMAVSDLHGGGLTLQRVLGDDLNRIARFVYPTKFARQVPPTPALRSRSEFAVSILEEESTRRLLGKYISAWLVGRGAAQLWHARRVANLLDKRFPNKDTLFALVCPQARAAVYVLEFLKSIRQVRYITWMMDDHLVRYVQGRWVYPSYPPGFRDLFGKHLREADSVFVISPIMAEFYEREFGVKSTVLFGPCEEFPGQPRETASRDGILRIGYFGRLWGGWQLDGLTRLATALDPSWQKLDIYTPDTDVPEVLQLPGVTAKGSLTKEAVRQTALTYDAVILPLSFDAADRHLVELNIATKMSECVASGTVPIVFGPSYAAMVRFLEPAGAACVVTDASLKGWQSTANRLLEVSYRRQLLDRAKRLVQAELSTAVMRRKWSAALARLTEERVAA
jgi:hypothetical protein